MLDLTQHQAAKIRGRCTGSVRFIYLNFALHIVAQLALTYVSRPASFSGRVSIKELLMLAFTNVISLFPRGIS